jgi:hypothetical protein
VQQLFDKWRWPVNGFAPLLQAVLELAVQAKDDTEKRLVEALSSQLKMTKRTVLDSQTVTADIKYDKLESTDGDT